VGDVAFDMSLLHWVNDGLLTIFFIVVALESKREFTIGSLAGRRSASLPVAAAIGGMALPARRAAAELPDACRARTVQRHRAHHCHRVPGGRTEAAPCGAQPDRGAALAAGRRDVGPGTASQTSAPSCCASVCVGTPRSSTRAWIPAPAWLADAMSIAPGAGRVDGAP
jgi:hypothetical protein